MTITLVHKNMGGKISSKSDERHSKVVGWVESEVVKRQDPTVIDGFDQRFDPRKSSVKRRINDTYNKIQTSTVIPA